MQALYPTTQLTIQNQHAWNQKNLDDTKRDDLATVDKEFSKDGWNYMHFVIIFTGLGKCGIFIYMFQKDALRMCLACVFFVLSLIYNMTQKKNIPWAITGIALLVTLKLGCCECPKHAFQGFQAMLLPGTSYDRTTIGPELSAVFSDPGAYCRFENSLLTLPPKGELDYKACMLKGLKSWKNKDTTWSRQLPIDVEGTIFVRVDLNMQRCMALLYIAWVYGWIVSFFITDTHADTETFSERTEVACTTSVFVGKALIFVFDYCFCFLNPSPSSRVHLFNMNQDWYMTPREWLGSPLCMCVFGLFVFEVLPRLMKS